MTRYLSQALGAQEPTFSQGLQQLEQAAGRPSADIRLTNELSNKLRAKLGELNLDPSDTTARELYEALQERLKADEIKIRRSLGIMPDASAETVVARVHTFLSHHTMPKQCFALKSSIAKKLLKKKPPKNVMKRLHYRSVDSMLKHETVANLYAAAFMIESATWHKGFREQYAKLRPSDFESREMTLSMPSGKRWLEVAAPFTEQAHHHILSFKDIGAVVMLPLETPLDGLSIMTLLLALEEMNVLRAYSSFIKLQQVKPDFGAIVQRTAAGDVPDSVHIAGQPLSWQTIHRFYARHKEAFRPEVFEPHVQSDDLVWLRAETVLTGMESTLTFWHGTESLGFLHEGELVSCNILDVALSYCNHLSFEDRVVHFVRHNIWHELMLKYLHQHNLEEAVHGQLAGELAAPELALQEQEIAV